MKQKTTWAENNDIVKTFLRTAQNLDKTYDEINIALSQQLYSLNKNSYHFINNLLYPEDRVERAYCTHLLNLAYQTEKISQGAGVGSFIFANAFTKSFLNGSNINKQNSTQLVERYHIEVDKIQELIREYSSPSSYEDIIAGINIATTDPLITQVIWEAISLSGLEGKVYIENGPHEHYLIEQKIGYNFKVKPYRFFLQHGETCWEAKNCKVLIIDGVIEEASELDHILTQTFETKIPFVIIAQGFSEEVIATLSANQKANNFNCIAIRIMPDLDSLNMANDIAQICGTIPVSCQSGITTTSTNYEDIPTVEHIVCSRNELTIENKGTRNAVSAHVRALLERRQQQSVEDITNIIDKRIRSLVANSVIINLPNVPANNIDDIRVKLDNGLRASKTLLNYGITDLDLLLSKLEERELGVSQALHEAISKLRENDRMISTMSLIATLHTVGKTMLLLLSSNGMVRFS